MLFSSLSKRSATGHFMRLTGVFLLVVFVFFYGVGVGVYGWPPYKFLKNAQDRLERAPAPVPPYLGSEQELLRGFAFSEPLIAREQILPRLNSFDDIHAAFNSLLVPVEQFFDAYANLTIIQSSTLSLDNGSTRVLKISGRASSARYRERMVGESKLGKKSGQGSYTW